ncbi:phosphorylcholine transferase LicD [Nocardioides sp. R-C-SC26]|uniref:LicD family protein n=1 Tax=Nocardioides sp. R-C-SC26 TaxID=2870414 RepID=UPI001E642331|nr:LicD family protein [Nocardioides sp. R-C-SC26]
MSTGPEIDREGLAALQALVRGLMAEFDRALGVLQIPYHLAYGTAIGAVRDADLIPWDVDADVWVEHRHYRRLLAELPAVLGDDFELVAPENTPGYEYLFPRLAYRRIHHVLIRLDVFPLDPAWRRPWSRRVYTRLMRALDRAYFVKQADLAERRHYSARKRMLTTALRTLLAPVPAAALRGVFRRLQASGSRDHLVNSCGAYGARETFRAAWFDGEQRYRVGSMSLPVPREVEAVLGQLYGDFMTPVSAEQQERELVAATDFCVAPLRAQGVLAGPNEEGSR